jgi:putative hydrolase of the HAD superfamily
MIEFDCQTLHRLVYETLGISFSISYVETEREFWRSSVKYAPMPGIYDLLDVLEAKGIKTGIVSNTIFSSAILSEELAMHDLARRFSFVVSSGDYGIRKPHVYIFRLAANKLGLPPSRIWFVGDKPDYDIKGALDSGLYPVWFNWRHETRAMDGDYLEITALTDLKDEILRLV